ncbi:hypothetical protein V6N13_057449 [Hibiscus sabdariffa]
MTPLPSSLYRAWFLWSGLCIARQVRAMDMPSWWGEFVTPTWPTTRGFGHVDELPCWLYATRLDNFTPNSSRPCGATVLGGVSRPSNVRASDLIKSQWVLLMRHPAHPCPDTTKKAVAVARQPFPPPPHKNPSTLKKTNTTSKVAAATPPHSTPKKSNHIKDKKPTPKDLAHNGCLYDTKFTGLLASWILSCLAVVVCPRSLFPSLLD